MADAIFLSLLQVKGLFPGDLKEQVQVLGTKADKASYFLNTIKRYLDAGYTSPFMKLLLVMSDEVDMKNGPLKQLASEIKQELSLTISQNFTGL